MSERALPLVKVVRLEGSKLAQVPGPTQPPVIAALAILLLIGTAWWAVSGD